MGSTTGGRKCLGMYGIDERSRRDIASYAGDTSPCTGVLRNSRLLARSCTDLSSRLIFSRVF